MESIARARMGSGSAGGNNLQGATPRGCPLYLELRVEDGGVIVLQPVAVYPAIRPSERGIEKLREARESGTAPMPEWMSEEISDIS
jgi:hypothetical protein